MSVTECRSCGGPITFVRTANERWRPVEVVFEELVPEGAEILVTQSAGSWEELRAQAVRIYTTHSCPENPAWNRGRPRTRTVNEATGELLEDDGIHDAPPDPRPSPPTDGLTWQERDALVRKNNWLTTYPVEVKYPCRECGVEPNEPCLSGYGRQASKPHRPRNIASYFDEDDGQPWPPRRNNQRGVQIMRGWLQLNGDIFALPSQEQS